MNKVFNKPKTSTSDNITRKENRFNYSMDILVRTKSKRGKGSTINISETGMKFSTVSPLKVTIKDFVYINMPELNEYLNSHIKNSELDEFSSSLVDEVLQEKTVTLFMYEVVFVEKKLDKIEIACQYIGHNTSDMDSLQGYIKDKLHSCEIDSSFDLDNIKFNYYDFLYFNDIKPLVYYFSPDEKKCLFVQSTNNRSLYDYVTHPETNEVDLLVFTSTTALDSIYNNIAPGDDFYLFVFYKDNELNFYYDFETNNKNELISFLYETTIHNGHVFRGINHPVTFTDYKKNISSKSQISFDMTNKLQQVVLYDVSKCINQYFSEVLNIKDTPASLPEFMIDENDVYSHEIFNYNPNAQRKEERYLYHTAVTVSFSKDEFVSGELIDMSYSGISLLLNSDSEAIKLKSKVWLTYNDLNKTLGKLQLTKIPYVVKNITQCGLTNKPILGLQRVSKDCAIDVNQFFETVIDKNSSKLTPCKQDKLDYAEKQSIQNKLKQTLDCIPIFLDYKNDKLKVKEIKIYNELSKLVQFFKISGEYDFSALTRQQLISGFSDYLQVEGASPKPLIAFFVKIDGEIKVITNNEVTETSVLRKIALDTIKRNGLCVLIKFRVNNSFDEQAFEMSYKSIRLTELDEMNLAKEKVNDICGYMELNDITSIVEYYL